MRARPVLSTSDIESVAEQLLQRLAPSSLVEPMMTPLAEIAIAECARLSASLRLRSPLGRTARGQPIRGYCRIHEPYAVAISADLDMNEAPFRFTLAHELGHLELHRDIDLRCLDGVSPSGEINDDDRALFQGRKHPERSERYWLEWQANTFAAALLMPKATVAVALSQQQRKMDIRIPGRVYVDRQPDNVTNFRRTIDALASVFQTSKTSIRYRLRNLGLLLQADGAPSDNVSEQPASGFRHVLDYLKPR